MRPMQPILKENKMLIKRFIIVGCFLISTNLYAEAITDGTLGRVESLSGNFTIPDNLGQQEGGNLFHSFQTFNINTGESATFTGPSSVENIISRVTGRSESFIDGTLSSEIDGANLYLLNPSGILFGENARLDITGSFHASTADVLHLEEGGRFDATHPSNSLLTVAQPAAFGFLGNDPGAIIIQGSSIDVIEGQEISIIGGDISIEGGALNAPSGRINLASVASEGQVIPQSEGLIMESFEKQGNISLSQFFWPEEEPEPLANIDVNGDGGQVFIRAGQFVLDNAWIWADTDGEQNGRIDIVVDGDMHLTNSSEIAAYNYGTIKERLSR
ncbi:MAG TPA: filamentous hemagglutinin N-terminal domain-containing protein [Thiotrichaceae bacterium]|nr:filamentous hemagglutinin N-terminal domain-containing protein [Thiotrichaceae bacterium]